MCEILVFILDFVLWNKDQSNSYGYTQNVKEAQVARKFVRHLLARLIQEPWSF